jgi:predicted kinase
MIVELNGLAGVGKLTIGRIVAQSLDARLIDNHTIYDPAFATTDFGSEEFRKTVRAVRAIVFDRATHLPGSTPILLTIAPGRDRNWGEEWQDAIRRLADARGVPLYGVHLRCAPAELARRIADPGRAGTRKLTDAAVLADGAERPVLLDHCDRRFDLDITALSAAEAAEAILRWVRGEAG